MTTKTEKKVAEEEVKVEEKFKPSDYSCEILLEKTTLVKAQAFSYTHLTLPPIYSV